MRLKNSELTALKEWLKDKTEKVLKMNTYEKIQNEINELRIDADKDLMCVLNVLQDQFNRAGATEWTIEELSDLIKSENDVLDRGVVEEGMRLWDEIRNIQDSIIGFFGKSSKEK